jgi:AcrR family transcriptional regulator
MSGRTANGVARTEDPTPGPFDPDSEDLRPFALSRLPIGRHDLPPEFVAENQRNRIMAAAISSLAERGYGATSTARIIAAAGISNTTFYLHYADKEACVLAAYTASVAWLESEVAAAIDLSGGWPTQVADAVSASLALLDADRRIAQLCVAEILCAGPAGQACHRETIDRLGRRLDLGRRDRTSAGALPPELEPALIAGAISLVDRRLESAGAPFTGSAAAITEFLLIPYLGPAAGQVAGARD